MQNILSGHVEKIQKIILSFFIITGLNYLLQPLLKSFFIDEIFFREYPYIFCLYLIFLAIICHFITYFLDKMLNKEYFQQKKQLKEEYMQINSMKEYINQIEDLYLNIRSFKHDYINILSSFHSYINEHNYEGLEKYFSREILPAGLSLAFEDSVYGRLGFIQVPEIKSIVYTKILCAKKQKINIMTSIKEKIDYFPMNTLDLVRVLGILLDNAIEASILTNEKFLSITFFKDAEDIYIQIQNSSLHIDNVEELYKTGASSKGEGHGIGLYEVRRIVNKYSNILLNTEYNNFIFSQQLFLNHV